MRRKCLLNQITWGTAVTWHSSPLLAPKKRAAGTNTLCPYNCGQWINRSLLPGERANPNPSAISCSSFLRSFGPGVQISPACLQPPENFWQGQWASGWAKAYTYLPWEKIKQTQHAQDWRWVSLPGRSLHPHSSGLHPATLQVSLLHIN